MGEKNYILELTKLIRYNIDQKAGKVNDNFLVKIKKKLSFPKIEDWHILCSSLDLIEDTEWAKENFVQFGVCGPTKYNDIGEKYLRLYGFLNSIYLQFSSIKQILKIIHYSNCNTLLNELEQTKLLKLRHIAGAHTLSYDDKINKQIKTYMLAQNSLNKENLCLTDEKNQEEEFNIQNELKIFDKIMIDTLFKISNSFFTKIYQCETEKRKKVIKEIDDLYQVYLGKKIIIKLQPEKEVVIEIK